MKVLLVVTALMAMASVDCAVQEDKFEAWKKKFGKVYKSKEKESQCRAKWLENQKLVLEHNKLADQGNLSYRLGMTDFADMSLKEYKNLTLKDWLPFNHTRKHNATKFLQQTRGAPLPDTVNWRNKGYVTEVEYQRYCGSCWAFSAAGALEGQIFRTTRKLVPLSKQQLVDCSRSFGNKGCDGGWMNQAFEYVKQNGGLNTEKSYPYNGRDGNCKFDPAAVGATCTGYVDIRYEDENALRETVATIGPVSVAIDADQQSFQLYNSGVYDEPACESMRPTHAVLIVGYGTENGKDYWLVKNSWGVGWGDKGYIKMSRNKKNQCGIASFASYPLVPSKTLSNVAQCETCSTTFVLGFFLFCMFY